LYRKQHDLEPAMISSNNLNKRTNLDNRFFRHNYCSPTSIR